MRTPYRSPYLLAILAVGGMLCCSEAFANQAPSVSIASPANEYEALSEPANLTLTANASDSDGTIAKVEYYQGSTLIGTGSAGSPFSFAWNNVAAGRYALTAKATDNGGAVTTSAIVYVTINGAALSGFEDRKYYSVPSGTGYMQYRLFIPAGYDPTKKYPLVLFLHGVGEGGTDNAKQLNNNANGAMVFVSAANQAVSPCFMIAPQSTSGFWSGNGDQIGIVKRIQAEYNVDVDRTYITGLSAGGMGTWSSLIANPDLFAAAVPICGNGDNSKANLLTGIPIWNHHCADDPTVGVGGSDSMISAVRAAGGNPIFTRYATGGHGAWVPAYANPKTVPWLMAQRRGVAATNSPLLAITTPTSQPTYTTNATTLSLAGTTIDSSTLVTQIAWTNSLGGSGTGSGTANWTITGIPIQAGDNLIQVIATGTSYSSGNGGATTFNDTIKVTYSASGNNPPTISTVPAQSVNTGASTGALAFTVADIETAAASLAVTGSSSNTTLLPNANIVFGGSGTNRTVTATPAAGQNGSAAVTLTVSDGSATGSSSFVLTVSAPPSGTVAAIDCGGTADFTAADGTVYKADTAFNGGSVNNFVRPIANTTDDALYQTYRWNNPSLIYSIPVPNGQYAVTLKFADTFSSAAGQKVFDVKSEGVYVVQNLDVYALAGKDTAYDITCAANVTDGKLDLEFLAGAAGNPSINAILVKARTNKAPTAAAQQLTTLEDTAKTLVLAGTDADGDVLTYSVATQPLHGTLSGTAPNLTYTPNANFSGSDSFTFKVSDGAASSAAATVSLTVTAVNDAPSISAIANQTVNEDTATASIPFTVGDLETPAASLLVTGSSSNVALVPVTKIAFGGSGTNRTVIVTPMANQSGTATITLTVTDGTLTASTTFTLTVLAVNDPPVIASAATAAPNPTTIAQAVVFDVSASDIDGDLLSYDWNFGDGASGTGASASHTYAAAGQYSATVTVSDGNGGSATSQVSISVTTSGGGGSGGGGSGGGGGGGGGAGGGSAFSVKINFQQAASATPAGYLADSGAIFGDRGNGYSYGWNAANSSASRDRNAANSPDQRYDTLIHLQKPENPNASWQIALPNGMYSVHAVCGDPSYFDSVYRLYAEGTLVVSGTPTSTLKWFQGTQVVTVSDGFLTLGNGAGSVNNKICFVEIDSAPAAARDLDAADVVAEPLKVTQLQLQMNFAKKSHDGYRVSGAIPSLPADFKPAGVMASIDVGAAIVNFTLDAKAHGANANGRFAMKFIKKSGWVFQASVKSGAWMDDWADGGIENVSVKNVKAELPVTLTLGGRTFGGSKWVKFTVVKNKTGKAK